MDEIHELHRLENVMRDKIFELNNVFKIKAGLKDLGRFDNSHVLIEKIKLEGEIAELLVRVDPTYARYMTFEGNKKVIYAKLTKALYGTLQASYLFWKDLSNHLVEEMGFEVNPYDWCVANKTIDGEQCTIAWHVDDSKISHQSQEVAENMLKMLEGRYGNEAPLSVTRGKSHKYLGMDIDFGEPGKVRFSMVDYIQELLAEAPSDLMKGLSTTPAANYLFNTRDGAELLGAEDAVMYHHLTAKLLYLSKRTRPD